LSLGAILQTQIVCAGSTPPGWIKINDAWNPTVCGNPAAITYNVWTIQQFIDQPPGAVIHACKGSVPSGWAVVGTGWNPTVCGHPAASLPNVMAIKRLN
jgi:isopentenyldiphosphate isomerase